MRGSWESFVGSKLKELQKGEALPYHFGCISNLLTGKSPKPQTAEYQNNESSRNQMQMKNQEGKGTPRFRNYFPHSDDQESDHNNIEEKRPQPFKSPRGIQNSPLPKKQETAKQQHDSDEGWYSNENVKIAQNKVEKDDEWEMKKQKYSPQSKNNSPEPVFKQNIPEEEESWVEMQVSNVNDSKKKISKRQIRNSPENESDNNWNDYQNKKEKPSKSSKQEEYDDQNQANDSDGSWESITRKEEPKANKPPPVFVDSDGDESSVFVPPKASKHKKIQQNSETDNASERLERQYSDVESNADDAMFNYANAFREIGDAVFGKYWVPIEDTVVPRLSLDSKLLTSFRVKRFEKLCKQLTETSRGNSLTYSRRVVSDNEEE